MTRQIQLMPNSLQSVNQAFSNWSAQQRIAWALKNGPGKHVLSSSFGAQAAVMLHMLTQQHADIPVILIDTGYLFPETYRFVDKLVLRLQLNLKVYRSTITPAWQEASYGKLWEQGIKGINRYNQINKLEPMRQALNDLQAKTWFAGLRRGQTKSRENTDFIRKQQDRYKIHPIADWNDRDVWRYLQHHQLPYHPLWEKGYVSIGDTHTTHQLQAGMATEATRFFGLKRECGLHTDI